MKRFVDRIRRLSLHSFWSDLNTVMEPVDLVAVYDDDCYKGLWEISIRNQQHMKNQQETELCRKCPEIH